MHKLQHVGYSHGFPVIHSLCPSLSAKAAAATTAAAADARRLDVCSSNMQWKSTGGKLMLNGQAFHLKGAK
jgi:hypothetical protein